MPRHDTAAHQKAVEALVDARQHVRKYVFDLERQDVPPTRIFINSEHPEHPQKNAHAALMDYYQEVNQPEYTVKVSELWQEKLSDAGGNPIEVTVPKNNVVTKTVTEETVGNFVPDMDTIETKDETVALETLAHKWAGRSITVRAKVDSPYRTEDVTERSVRVWLPPVLIKAAYKQLNACLSKVGLLARPTPPMASEPELVDPREQPWVDGEPYLRDQMNDE